MRIFTIPKYKKNEQDTFVWLGICTIYIYKLNAKKIFRINACLRKSIFLHKKSRLRSVFCELLFKLLCFVTKCLGRQNQINCKTNWYDVYYSERLREFQRTRSTKRIKHAAYFKLMIKTFKAEKI